MIFFRQLIVTWSQKSFSKRRNNTSFVSIPTENILWHQWAYQWFLEILVISHSCHECVIKPKSNPKIQIPDESNKEYKILHNQFMADFKRKTSFLAYSVIWLNILNRNKRDKENKKGQQMFFETMAFYFVCVWIFHISITALFNTAWHSFLWVESNTYTNIASYFYCWWISYNYPWHRIMYDLFRYAIFSIWCIQVSLYLLFATFDYPKLEEWG